MPATTTRIACRPASCTSGSMGNGSWGTASIPARCPVGGSTGRGRGPMSMRSADAQSTAADTGLTDAARRFFPEATSIEPAAGRSHLARVEAPSGVWAVRQWPAGTPRTRLDFVHALLKESKDAGIAFVPEVAARPDDGTVIAIGGSFYDAESWLPGRAPTRGLDLVDDRGR